MTKYLCDDGNAEIAIEAGSPLEAAQQYVDTGDWNAVEQTIWIDVYVTRDMSDVEERLADLIGEREYSDHQSGWWVYAAADLDIEVLKSALPGCSFRLDEAGDLDVDHGEERERITVALDPEEPDCSDDEHDWQSPYGLLGGIKENPGVWGNGGGVVIRQVCARCGRYRITDTWAQNPVSGVQGLESVAYEDADEASLAWVASLAEEASS